MILPKTQVAEMAPYQLASLSVPEGKHLISMAQNESLRAPSPKALEAMGDDFAGSAMYPDPDWSELRRAIEDVHGIPATSVLCGAGSMELIASLAHTFLTSGDDLLTTEYAYAFIKTVAQFTGASFKTVPELERRVVTDHLTSAISSNTKMVFIANPGNPTGTRISSDEIRELRETIPSDTLLIVDEAYGEFCDHIDNKLFDLPEKTNTVILRTFSKAYGLAGLRVGWGCFPSAVSEHTRKVLNPNNVSSISQAAAAAAMADQDYMLETCRITCQLRDKFAHDLRKLDIKVDDSHTNFVLLRFANEGEALQAAQFLQQRGILMRPMHGYGLPHCLRATIVAADDLEFVTEEFRKWRSGETDYD